MSLHQGTDFIELLWRNHRQLHSRYIIQINMVGSDPSGKNPSWACARAKRGLPSPVRGKRRVHCACSLAGLRRTRRRMGAMSEVFRRAALGLVAAASVIVPAIGAENGGGDGYLDLDGNWRHVTLTG